jgi:probable rRNA maturation factor
MSILFTNEGVTFTLKNKKGLKQWIVSTIEKKERKSGDLNFIFCSDAYLLNINNEYLNHDTYTDIITFDYSRDDKKLPVSGDIFISVDRIKENATKFSKSFEEELHRVIIHGTLHLLGYADKTKKAKAEMTAEEDRCLSELGKMSAEKK